MRIQIVVTTGLFLVLAVSMTDFAGAAGGSIEEGFDALAKSKSGAKTTGQGIGEQFDALGKGKGNPATGHGIETNIKDVEAYRAEQKAKKAEAERVRMEAKAKEEDKDLEKECVCILANNCTAPIKLWVSSDPRKRESEVAQFQEEVVRPWRAGIKAKKPICEAWKAAGSKANSESFKAQLRQQDKAIAAAQSVAAELARQRDAMIEADIKRSSEQAKSDEQAREKAVKDAEKRANLKLAAEKKAREDEAAKKKDAYRIRTLKNYDYQLDKNQFQTWCQRSQQELRAAYSKGRNQIISMGECKCIPAKK